MGYALVAGILPEAERVSFVMKTDVLRPTLVKRIESRERDILQGYLLFVLKTERT
jgi:hypothetical protein